MMHTKEPWFCRDGDQFQHDIIVTTDDRLCRGVVPICEIESDFTAQVGDEQKENARRIVAAVNACADIPTEDLEAVPSFGTDSITTVRDVKQQRDELESLNRMQEKQVGFLIVQRDDLLAALRDARSCIAVDRESLVECEKDPVTGQVDFAAQQVVAEYDAVLNKIDAAIARAQGEAK